MSRLYGDRAFLWDILTPKDVYFEEASLYWTLLNEGRGKPIQRMAELGSGGGYLAQHFTDVDELILVDRSQEMIALSEERNPTAQHLCADMCHVDFGAPVDAVLIHDAVMYLSERSQLLDCLHNIRRQLRPDGRVLIIPDLLKDTFFEHIQTGEVADEYHHVHLTEWRWVPHDADAWFNVAFSVMLKKGDEVESIFEVHKMGCFSYSEWLHLFKEADLKVCPIDLLNYALPRELFLLTE